MKEKTAKSMIIEAILLCAFLFGSIAFIGKSIKDAKDKKDAKKLFETPKVKNMVKSIAKKAQNLLKSIDNSSELIIFSKLDDSDFYASKVKENNKSLEIYVNLGKENPAAEDKYPHDVLSKRIKEINDLLKDMDKNNIFEIIDQSDINLRIVLKDIDSIKDCEEKKEAIKNLHESYQIDIDDYKSLYEYTVIRVYNESDRSYRELDPKAIKDDIKLDKAPTENLVKVFKTGVKAAQTDKSDRQTYGQATRAETAKVGEELKKRGVDPEQIKNESVIEESFKENRQKARDLEDSYDKKYNAFCLTVSGYSVEKLQSTLAKKQDELAKAKENLKSASKEDRIDAKLKIDYLKNTCAKCQALIKRKSKI